jgi:hypothetical protein
MEKDPIELFNTSFEPDKCLDTGRKNSLMSPNSEPEMEEFNEGNLVKTIFKELEINTYIDKHTDPFIHNPNYANGQCLHCSFSNKFTALKDEITRMNQEISTTHEILNFKKNQNRELKNTIKRLENTLGKNSEELVFDQKEQSCSCASKCLIQ